MHRGLFVKKQFNYGSFYWQACMKRSHAGIVFTQWSQNRFSAPQGQHVAPINVKFGTGERTEGSRSAPFLHPPPNFF